MRRLWRGLAISLIVALALLLVGPFLIPIPPLQGTVPPEALADADSHFAAVDGLRLHYKIMGDGEPAIVLLHGFGASVFSWREVMAPLSGLGMVVAFCQGMPTSSPEMIMPQHEDVHHVPVRASRMYPVHTPRREREPEPFAHREFMEPSRGYCCFGCWEESQGQPRSLVVPTPRGPQGLPVRTGPALSG